MLTLILIMNHVVGGNILVPGVAYIETAIAASGHNNILTALAFVRPCVLPGLSAEHHSGILMQYTR